MIPIGARNIGVLKARRPGLKRWSEFARLWGSTMILNRHFREFIGLLEKHGIKYLVVGGYAVGLHGFDRQQSLHAAREG